MAAEPSSFLKPLASVFVLGMKQQMNLPDPLNYPPCALHWDCFSETQVEPHLEGRFSLRIFNSGAEQEMGELWNMVYNPKFRNAYDWVMVMTKHHHSTSHTQIP